MSTHFSLFKKHRIYYVQYTNPSGIRRQKSTRKTTKVEVIGFLRVFDSKETQPHRKEVGRTIDQFADEYREYSRGVFSKGTHYLHGLALRELIAVTGNIPLRQVTPTHLDLLKSRLTQQVNPPTANERLSKLKAILNSAVRWRLIESNPMNEIKLVKEPERVAPFFSHSSLQQLLLTIKETWLKEVITFAVLTGLRR